MARRRREGTFPTLGVERRWPWAERSVLGILRWRPWLAPKEIAAHRPGQLTLRRTATALRALQGAGIVVRKGRGPWGRWAVLGKDGKVKGADLDDVLTSAGGGVAGHARRLAAPWPCPPPPRPPDSVSLWDLPPELRVQLDERARRWLLAHLAERGFRAHKLHSSLNKTSTRTDVHSASASIDQLSVIADVVEISHEEMEAAVVCVHAGTPGKPLLGPFPKPLTVDWAWVVGFFMGAGAATVRDRAQRNTSFVSRERAVRFRFDDTVTPLFEETMTRAGASWTYSTNFERTHLRSNGVTYGGPVTRAGRLRRRALMCKPFYFFLEAAGVKVRGRAHEGGGRGRAARHMSKALPEWTVRSPEYRKAVVEGFLNTTAAQVTWAAPNKGHVYARLRISITCEDTASRHALRDLIVEEFRRAGVNHIKAYEGGRGRIRAAGIFNETSVHVTGHRDFMAVLRAFRVRKQKAIEADSLGGHIHEPQ